MRFSAALSAMVPPSQVVLIRVGTASALSGLIAETATAAITASTIAARTTVTHLAAMETPSSSLYVAYSSGLGARVQALAVRPHTSGSLTRKKEGARLLDIGLRADVAAWRGSALPRGLSQSVAKLIQTFQATDGAPHVGMPWFVAVLVKLGVEVHDGLSPLPHEPGTRVG